MGGAREECNGVSFGMSAHAYYGGCCCKKRRIGCCCKTGTDAYRPHPSSGRASAAPPSSPAASRRPSPAWRAAPCRPRARRLGATCRSPRGPAARGRRPGRREPVCSAKKRERDKCDAVSEILAVERHTEGSGRRACACVLHSWCEADACAALLLYLRRALNPRVLDRLARAHPLAALLLHHALDELLRLLRDLVPRRRRELQRVVDDHPLLLGAVWVVERPAPGE